MSVSTLPGPAPQGTAGIRSAAMSARHWFLVAAPVAAGLLTVLGAAADPAVDQDGARLVAEYAANPDPLQWKSIGYHFGYALWGFAAIMIALRVRGRGSWVANLALLFGLLGATTLPGFLMSDFFDSAIGQAFGVEGADRIQEIIDGMWGMGVISATGVAGFMLCLPVAVLAAWRARLLPWWAAVGPIAGFGLGFMLVGANVPGALIMTAGFAVLSVGLAGMPDDARPRDDVPTPAPSAPSAA